MGSPGLLDAILRCPPAPGWDDLRAGALGRLQGADLPTPRQEDWKYLDLRALRETTFQPCTEGTASIREHILPEAIGSRLVFVNGRPDNYHSCTSSCPQDLVFRPLDPQEPLDRPPAQADVFELMNAARFISGVRIHVPKDRKCEVPLHLLFAQQPGPEPMAFFPRLHVTLDAGAELTLVEEHLGTGTYLSAPYAEVRLGQGAVLRHERIQRDSPEAFHIATLRAETAQASRYELRNLTLGGRLSRHAPEIRLLGGAAELHLDGLVLVEGEQVADAHSTIDHTQPGCTSRQLHKCIADGKARAIFNGKIFVRPGAQATDAQQQSRNLLLSATARVDTKPQLEIFADDVKCAHGAAVGQLDAEEVFYLRSRGLDEPTARNLLTWAFASEVLNRISVPSLRRSLRHAVMARTHAAALETEL